MNNAIATTKRTVADVYATVLSNNINTFGQQMYIAQPEHKNYTKQCLRAGQVQLQVENAMSRSWQFAWDMAHCKHMEEDGDTITMVRREYRPGKQWGTYTTVWTKTAAGLYKRVVFCSRVLVNTPYKSSEGQIISTRYFAKKA